MSLFTLIINIGIFVFLSLTIVLIKRWVYRMTKNVHERELVGSLLQIPQAAQDHFTPHFRYFPRVEHPGGVLPGESEVPA